MSPLETHLLVWALPTPSRGPKFASARTPRLQGWSPRREGTSNTLNFKDPKGTNTKLEHGR